MSLFLTTRDYSSPPPVGVLLFFGVLFGIPIRLMRGDGISVDDRCVTIKGIFDGRTLLWSFVQGIEIQEIQATMLRATTYQVVLYEPDGTPHDILAGRDRGKVEAEAAALREVWIRQRGEQWTVDERAAARITRECHRSRRPFPFATMGYVVVFVSLFAAISVPLIF